MECQYCKSSFLSKAVLNNHQKTAKYCILLRNAQTTIEYECKKCKLNEDKNILLSQYENRIKKLEKIIDDILL